MLWSRRDGEGLNPMQLFNFIFLGVFLGEPADTEILTLQGTKPLLLQGDIASHLVDGVDRFLLRELEESIGRRGRHWKRDRSSPERYGASLALNRRRLAHILGVRDERIAFDGVELRGTTAQPALVGRGGGYQVFAASWPAFGDVHGEGLLALPVDGKVAADIVAIPDADQTPEEILGLAGGVPAESQFARRLAESGCRVLVPALIDRKPAHDQISRREFLYRSAFELGRHIIGYEIQKVLAGVDWFSREAGEADPRIGVVGWGEGGLLAFYAAALDERIDAACISGYFDTRQNIWQEPISRNVFGLLEEFGDAEIASMIAPRTLIVEAAGAPEVIISPGSRAGPGRIVTPNLEDIQKELERTRELAGHPTLSRNLELVISGNGTGPYGSPPALQAFLSSLSGGLTLEPPAKIPEHLRSQFDPEERQKRLVHELDRHNQWLLAESPEVRKKFFSKLDLGSLEKFESSLEWYRQYFRNEVIGQFEDQLLPPHPRSRTVYDQARYTGYEIVLDVFPDVIAYGILLIPKDLKPSEKRPAVVCQHGLEGRPRDVADPSIQNPAYNQFACRLAERGFITFSPQNLYIFRDRFRTLQRKANPLKKTLFSIMVPQHQQITSWLGSLPFVDPHRIGFYGLSYGGKTAMRVPPLVENYCLSICSADFNEWVWKNASTRSRYSYVWTGEYEIFEFDLGSTFNYAEMAALIAPRPFMVERGHFDGVAPDETVAYEFAKVRFLYSAKLGIGDRCAIEWFVGPHSINGKGTFDFLHRHLSWPKPEAGR